jgi:radical SAM superfamily enzyme YgiQ (UPF0313 family)
MICLIRPPAAECVRFATTSLTLPLGLAYIAGALEAAKYEVAVIDAVGEAPEKRTRYITGYLIGLPLEEIARLVPAQASLVGISVIFTHEWPAVVRLVELIKACRPDLRVVLGGEHITSMPEFCLLTSKADFLVLGEGEETIVELAAALERDHPLAAVDGLVYRDGDAIVSNRRRRRRRDLDAVAWPAWHHFALQKYNDNRFVGGIYTRRLTIPILATRGCPYQCTYCSAPGMWTPLWIPRDPVRVVDEIQHYVETYGAGNFPFQDLTAIIQKDWIVRFCEELIARKLDICWQLPSGTRSEAIDSEVAELLHRSGMNNMAYAPESGSEETRRFVKKKMHTERLFQSVEAAVGAGLNVSLFMVLGLPHDKAENIAQNLPFLQRLRRTGVKDVSVAYYMALPGTELFDSLYDAGKIRLDRKYFYHMLHNLSLIPVRSYSEHLGRLELAAWKLRLLLRFYATKGRAESGVGIANSVRRGLRGLRGGGHDSKLPTAFRNAASSTWHTLRTQFVPGWVSRREEARLFADWDDIYRSVRRERIAAGVSEVSPADTTKLHERNVVTRLRRDQETGHTLVLPRAVGSTVMTDSL